MIAAETMAELEARGLPYILGVRERSDKLVRELVLDNRMPFTPLTTTAGPEEVEYEAKTTRLAGRRYIVCRDHAQAATDAADRALILAALEQRLAGCDNALVGHTGYRRYLKAVRSDQFTIDPDKVEEDKRFDGISVLRTNTRPQPTRRHTVLRAIVDHGADIPGWQAPLFGAVDPPRARCDNPRASVLQLPRPGAQESPWKTASRYWASGAHGPRSSPISIP
jgi:hypothetical protein